MFVNPHTWSYVLGLQLHNPVCLLVGVDDGCYHCPLGVGEFTQPVLHRLKLHVRAAQPRDRAVLG